MKLDTNELATSIRDSLVYLGWPKAPAPLVVEPEPGTVHATIRLAPGAAIVTVASALDHRQRVKVRMGVFAAAIARALIDEHKRLLP